MADFAIDKFVDLSGAVQTDDLDLEEAKRIGLTEREVRFLRYIADTESHTILYMRDLLAGHSARDPELCAFLSVWVYEELWHGRAIDRFLAACGHPVPADQYTKVTEGSAMKELVEAVLSHAFAYSTPKFIATHMTWGAINELTATAAQRALEVRTKNPALRTLLARMAQQERKHFAFYYYQAEKRLKDDKLAQQICTFALKRFWDIVGTGVGNDPFVEELAATLFADEVSRQPLHDATARIRELPGMGWFDSILPAVDQLRANYERRHGPVEPWPVLPQEKKGKASRAEVVATA